MAYTTVDDPVLIKKAFKMRESGMYVSDIAKQLSEESGKRITQMALLRLFDSKKEETIQDPEKVEIGNKKRRQGQVKPDGTKATPKYICPKCGEYLKRNYTRELVDGKQRFVKGGWTCPSITCEYITKDVELEENEDENH